MIFTPAGVSRTSVIRPWMRSPSSWFSPGIWSLRGMIPSLRPRLTIIVPPSNRAIVPVTIVPTRSLYSS